MAKVITKDDLTAGLIILEKNLDGIDDLTIETGVFEGEIAEYAAANEFGTKIAGRNKNVIIPERSFLRSTFDDKKVIAKVFKKVDRVISFQKINPDVIGSTIGELMVAAVVRKINSNIQPKNADSTLLQKNSAGTLRDEGELKKAIDYAVK